MKDKRQPDKVEHMPQVWCHVQFAAMLPKTATRDSKVKMSDNSESLDSLWCSKGVHFDYD